MEEALATSYSGALPHPDETDADAAGADDAGADELGAMTLDGAPAWSTADYSLYLRHLRFPRALESAFQKDYYRRVRALMRAGLLAATVLLCLLGLSEYATGHSITLLLRVGGPWLLVFAVFFAALTWRRRVWPWQPACLVVYSGVSAFTMGAVAREIHGNADPSGQQLSFLTIAFLLWIIDAFVLLRLQWRWAAAMLLVTCLIYYWAATAILAVPGGMVAAGFSSSLWFAVILLGLASYLQDRLFRAAFLAHHLLARRESDERHKRERTEHMLHVLSQAMGGIVHDLGNPLTAVQTGAQSLQAFAADDVLDRPTLHEFLEIIADGAQMLDYLRLSLLEEARVLEGKPIPVQRKNASIHDIVEAGARYQKPRLTSGHQITIVGQDLQLCVDAAKLITVFMNLIGNALKYSDGEIRITWRTDAEQLRIAVLDQGRAGRGLTRAQADRLFVPFGRLAAHHKIEGTGLGLLSVKRIVEAHGGEVFIEGYSDGTLSTAPFTTARGSYPAMLTDGFRTAFVVVCPLRPVAA